MIWYLSILRNGLIHSLSLLCCWNVQIRWRESFCFCVSRESRCILSTKIVELCLFLNKDLKQWKFCTSKGNILIDDKRSTTVTFIINLHETILAMQRICGGKTGQSLTKFDFLEFFLPNPWNYQMNYRSIAAFQYLHIPSSHTLTLHATLTSLTMFECKKMPSGGRERCFSSNYFTPKCN